MVMNKNEFTNELKELSRNMTPEQIERAIAALSKSRNSIYLKENQNKAEISRLLSTTEWNETELSFFMENAPESSELGTVKIIGASLLTREDYDKYKSNLPMGPAYQWWLYDKTPVYGSTISSRSQYAYAYVRPVLILSDTDSSGLISGNSFYINTERFKMISNRLALKTTCLQDSCSFTSESYESSLIRYCVEGWYARLVRLNRKLNAGSES